MLPHRRFYFGFLAKLGTTGGWALPKPARVLERRCLESGSLLPPLFHRCGIAVCGPFRSANRAAASKAARFFRRWRRFAAFPPLRHCGLRTLQVRKPRRCLESGSLLPPLAALRRFPPSRLLKKAAENFFSRELY